METKEGIRTEVENEKSGREGGRGVSGSVWGHGGGCRVVLGRTLVVVVEAIAVPVVLVVWRWSGDAMRRV